MKKLLKACAGCALLVVFVSFFVRSQVLLILLGRLPHRGVYCIEMIDSVSKIVYLSRYENKRYHQMKAYRYSAWPADSMVAPLKSGEFIVVCYTGNDYRMSVYESKSLKDAMETWHQCMRDLLAGSG